MRESVRGYVGLPVVGLTIIAVVGLVAWLSVREWRRRREVRHAGVIAAAGFIGVSVFFVFLALSMTKVFRSAQRARERSDCVANLNEVGKALVLYLDDNNDRAPLENWNVGVTKYIDPTYLACPLLKPYGYTMSEKVTGMDASEFMSPARTVAAFDGTGGKDSVGNENSIAYRHGGAAVFLYLDGHTKLANKQTFEGAGGSRPMRTRSVIERQISFITDQFGRVSSEPFGFRLGGKVYDRVANRMNARALQLIDLWHASELLLNHRQRGLPSHVCLPNNACRRTAEIASVSRRR